MNTATLTAPLSPAIMPLFPANYQRNTQRITLPYLNRTVFVSVDDIVSLEGEGNYTFLCTRDRKKYLVAKTLKSFAAILNPDQFVRIHKSYTVNLAYVRTTDIGREHGLRMADGRLIAVSRRREKEMALLLDTYLRRLVR